MMNWTGNATHTKPYTETLSIHLPHNNIKYNKQKQLKSRMKVQAIWRISLLLIKSDRLIIQIFKMIALCGIMKCTHRSIVNFQIWVHSEYSHMHWKGHIQNRELVW